MKEWSTEDDAKILHLLSQGRTRRQIAVHFGVTRNAICGRVYRLKPVLRVTDDWLSMETAPRDRFALYRLADTSEERRGCIDFPTPKMIWDPELKHYRPLVHFNGWKPLPEMTDGR